VEKIGAPETFALFLAFFIPGFVMSTVWGLLVPTERIDFSKELPRLIGYSVLHYSATLWLVFVVPAGISRLIAAYTVVFFVPIMWPPLLLVLGDRERWIPRFSNRRFLQDVVGPSLRPWDDVLDSLNSGGGCWVRVRLKSGTWIGGALGRTSKYSSYPDPEQLYLAEELGFDEAGVARNFVHGTRGILVARSEIEFMEFFENG
jgi:hypothetical protein